MTIRTRGLVHAFRSERKRLLAQLHGNLGLRRVFSGARVQHQGCDAASCWDIILKVRKIWGTGVYLQ